MRTTFARYAVVGATALTAALSLLVSTPQLAGASTGSGYNDFSCVPSAAHPEPVVLLHGLGGTGDGDLGPMGKHLAADGYCAFTLTYGQTSPSIYIGGTIDMDTSARQIGAFIDQVLGATGASKVDIVGHSEGGFQALYVPKVTGYASKVDKVVAMVPPTHGTTVDGLVTVAQGANLMTLVNDVIPLGCPACAQVLAGSAPVQRLDDGPIAQPGITYTIIASRADILVTPHQSSTLGTTETAFVNEPGVHNSYLQDTCPNDPAGHIGVAYDSGIETMVTNALDPANAVPVVCSTGLPL